MMSKGDRIYNVNIKRLSLLTLPTWLRRPLCGALLYAGVSPLGRLLHELRTFRKETRYRLICNGQVCRLRGLLNDLYDPELRRIRIYDNIDSNSGQSAILRMRGESELIVGRSGNGMLLPMRNMGSGSGKADFLVELPRTLLFNKVESARIRQTVRSYCLVSKRFELTGKYIAIL